MPTYLTPGVYVEEVPSASKPIEGVSTSIGRSWASRPAVPSTPRCGSRTGPSSRRSSATQRARQRPVHGRRVPRALRLRVLPERRQPVLGRPRGRRRRRQRRPRAALPAAADATVEAYRVVALEAGNGDVKVELTEEPSAGEKDGDKSYKLVVSSGSEGGARGPDAQEGPHEHRDEGQLGLQAREDRGDRRVAARGAASRRPAATRCRSRRSSPTRSSRPTSRATWPAARAWAASRPSTR